MLVFERMKFKDVFTVVGATLCLINSFSLQAAPQISVNPNIIQTELESGQNSEHAFTVFNEGDEALQVNIMTLVTEQLEWNIDHNPNGCQSIPRRDNPGEVLAEKQLPFNRTYGLAWDKNTELLWCLNTANPPVIYSIDLENMEVMDEFLVENHAIGLMLHDGMLYTLDNTYSIKSSSTSDYEIICICMHITWGYGADADVACVFYNKPFRSV